MKIIVNGKEEIIGESVTVAGLIALKKLHPNALLVEYNYELIKKENWDHTALKENDRLELLRLVGGG
ncbi:MAG: sulfur carrier protein ThiS [Syntrophaceae bacterium]